MLSACRLSCIPSTDAAVSLLLHDLGPVLELTGGIAATFLAFVMPAGAYLRVSRRDADHRWLAWAVVAFGALVAVLVPLQLVFRRAAPSPAAVDLMG